MSLMLTPEALERRGRWRKKHSGRAYRLLARNGIFEKFCLQGHHWEWNALSGEAKIVGKCRGHRR